MKPSSDLWVNMGLPSDTLWAKTNMDVTQANGFAISDFQYGCSFVSWGNVDMHNAVEGIFDYNFGYPNEQAPWFEDRPYGETPGCLIQSNIKAADDVSRHVLGSPWRLPTVNDFIELISYSDYIDAEGNVIPAGTQDKCVTVNGIVGIYLRSKVNANRLFLPCCGLAYGTELHNDGMYGLYWTSIYESELEAHRMAFFVGSGVNPTGLAKRNQGLSIRPVWRDIR